MMALPPRSLRGFSALELTLVVLIVGALAAVASTVWVQASSSNQRLGLSAQAQDLKKRVQAFAMERDRLPCPDLEGDGWESLTAGGGVRCAGVADALAWLPYNTLGLALPADDRRAAYAVRRSLAEINDDVEADPDTLRPGFRLARALRAEAQLADDDASRLHTQAAGQVRINVAFVIILPGEDRDGSGNAFDAPHSQIPGNSRRAQSPQTRASADYDDVVVAESYVGLLGLIGPAR